ncbi:MAG: hypothetical protein ACI3YD_00330 [Alloprevotella sp.]
MIRHIITSLFLFTAMQAQARSVNDTIIDLHAAQRVLMQEKDGNILLRIEGRDKDTLFTMHYTGVNRTLADSLLTPSKRRKHKNEWDFGNFHFGLVNAFGTPQGMDVDMGSSWEIGFSPVCYRWYNRRQSAYLSVGIELNWKNFRMTGRNRFVKDESDQLIIAPYPEEAAHVDFSRLKVFSLGVPVIASTDITRDIAVDLGVILNLNTYASVKTRYRAANETLLPGTTVMQKVLTTEKRLHEQRVTPDFMLRLRWRGVGIYAKYSPCKVLNTAWGPGFTPFSTGISFGL